ncbi:hypothetical protein IPM09_01875 [Candidatus Saccharibacteria bacterium]|nr:MAG: hypothetical protein IPM09_01875 [Candidatus Saccharibacteria bacterium]
MSEYTSANPDDANHAAEELLGKLELFRFDPLLQKLFDEIEIAQESLPGYDKREAKDQVKRLNEMLRSTGWIGTPVEVTGKLRIAPWCDIDEAYSDHVGSQARKGRDELGEYFEVVGLNMVCALIEIDTETYDDAATGRFVMTLTTPDAMVDAEDEVDDVDLEELLNSAGEYYFYRSDIVELSFREPSTEQTGVMLANHYPKILQRIHHDIPEGQPAGHHMLGALKRFELEYDVRYTNEFLQHIVDYIYARICPDSGQYRFTLDGLIGTAAVETGLEWEHMPERTKLSGVIVGFDMVWANDAYRMAFVVAEEAVAYDGGFELRLIPVDSVMKLECLRPSRKRFGELAVHAFTSPEEVMDYWREAESNPRPLPEIVAQPEVPGSNDEIFAALTDGLVSEMHAIAYHDSVLGADLVSIQPDIDMIVTDFADHVRMSEEWDIDTPLSASDLAAISKLMDKTLSRLEALRVGDRVVAGGRVLILDESEPGVSDVVVVDEGTCIVGTSVNTVICDVPELAFYDEESGTTPRSTIGVGILLENCQIIDGDEIHDAPFHSKQVIVVLSPSQGTDFYQVV